MTHRDPWSRCAVRERVTRDASVSPVFTMCRERVFRLVSLLNLVSDINQDPQRRKSAASECCASVARLLPSFTFTCTSSEISQRVCLKLQNFSDDTCSGLPSLCNREAA